MFWGVLRRKYWCNAGVAPKEKNWFFYSSGRRAGPAWCLPNKLLQKAPLTLLVGRVVGGSWFFFDAPPRVHSAGAPKFGFCKGLFCFFARIPLNYVDKSLCRFQFAIHGKQKRTCIINRSVITSYSFAVSKTLSWVVFKNTMQHDKLDSLASLRHLIPSEKIHRALHLTHVAWRLLWWDRVLGTICH